ncbi:MAG: hypothetical protein HZC28_03560 [Spirochaetes bacterium]|nr:hypothetical protein [Spirochaetota bacterium]
MVICADITRCETLIVGSIGSGEQISRELRSLRKAMTRGTVNEKAAPAAIAEPAKA